MTGLFLDGEASQIKGNLLEEKKTHFLWIQWEKYTISLKKELSA